MNVNGEYRIPAPRERLWEALRDTETLRACIPGCEAVRKVSEQEYELRLTAQVGAVTTVFDGRVVLSEEDFPRGWMVSAQVQSQAAGFADGQATVTLTAELDGTVLGYRARMEPGGRLASVGHRLLHGVAIRMANEFFVRLIERLKPPRPGAAPQELAEPVPMAPAPKINPIAPVQAASPGPIAATAAGTPAPESHATADLPYQGEVSPRTQRIVIVVGWIFFIVVVGVMYLPRFL